MRTAEVIGYDLRYAKCLWIAFYATAPLFVYDYLYLAIHQARGLAFLKSYWYLTVFYVLPWAVLPPIAMIAGRGNNTSSSDRSLSPH